MSTALVLTIAGILASLGDDRPPDIPYTTACGPIAVFVAQRSLGVPASLKSAIVGCRWTDGKLTTLGTLRDALRTTPGLDVDAVRLDPATLSDFISRGGVAILPIRKRTQDLDHAVCVVEADEHSVTLIDYPELRVKLDHEDLSKVWDGHAVLARRSRRDWLSVNWPWFLLPIAAAVACPLLIAIGAGRGEARQTARAAS